METRPLRVTPHFSELLACSQAVHSKKFGIAWLLTGIITNKWIHCCLSLSPAVSLFMTNITWRYNRLMLRSIWAISNDNLFG